MSEARFVIRCPRTGGSSNAWRRTLVLRRHSVDIATRAIDGSVVTISLNASQAQLQPWTSRTKLEWAGRGVYEIIAGVRSFPAAVVGAAGITLTEQTTIASWTVRHGSVEQYDNDDVYIGHLEAAAILGNTYGCLIHMYNVTAKMLLELVSLLAFNEATNGMAIESTSSFVHIDSGDTSVIQPATHLGVLEIRPMTSSQLRAVPSTDGAVTEAGGELFARHTGSNHLHYLILDRTAITSVAPVSMDPEGEAYTTALKSISASWQANN